MSHKSAQDKQAAVRAAQRALQLAHYADARLPKLPRLTSRHHPLLGALLKRCTSRSLLQADVEACDLSLDKWVASESLCNGFPPSHEHHPWHKEYVKKRDEELMDRPAPVDYTADRAAVRKGTR